MNYSNTFGTANELPDDLKHTIRGTAGLTGRSVNDRGLTDAEEVA